MYKINDDLSIYVTRGDAVLLNVKANDKNGNPYTFIPGDNLRFKVYKKKKVTEVFLDKPFTIEKATQEVQIYLSGSETKFDEPVNKPTTYWYEVVLNEDTEPQTIIGYDEEEGAKLFVLLPEGVTNEDVEDYEPSEEDRFIGYAEIKKELAQLGYSFEKTYEAVSKLHVTPQMFGAIGDGESDDTAAFEAMFATGRKVMLTAGQYVIRKPLVAKNSVYGETGSKIYYYPRTTDTYKACITIKGDKEKLCEGVFCVIEDYSIDVTGEDFSESVKPGDYIFIESTDKVSEYARDYDVKQDMLEVESVAGSTITFTTDPEWKTTGLMTLYRMNFIEDIEVASLNIECMEYVMCTSGVQITHAQNPNVRNCHIFNFDD